MHVVLTVNAAWNILNFRKPVVEALLARGDRLTVLAPPDEAVGALEALGCSFVPLEMDVKGLSPLEGVALVRRMRAQFQAIRPDIILSYTIKNNIFGAMAAKRLGVPFLPNVTGLGTAFLSGGPLKFVAETLYRWSFAKLPVVFFQNSDDLDLFRQRGLVSDRQARLLPGSGIDLEAFAYTPPRQNEQSVKFLMISRLLRDKGVVEFAQAAQIVRADHPQAVFQLLGPAGSANRTAISEAELAEWQASGAIEYFEPVPDVRPFIADADCVVLPSYREGAPRTLIEAAAMGRPLIATDVPGCRQVVRAGQTGFLCAPQDSQSLADACLSMLALDAGERDEMGRRARAHMEDAYDQRIVVGVYLSAIDQMTASGG